MTTQTDTGIPGDNNTNTSQPQFIGQVYNGFPGTVANLQVYVEFNGLHPELNGGFDLAVGGSGRGLAPGSHYDVTVTTDASGKFVISLPSGTTLPEGFQRAQVVVVGQPDEPPPSPLPASPRRCNAPSGSTRRPPRSPAPSSSRGPRWRSPARPRTRRTCPSLNTLTLNVVDPVNQFYSYMTTPSLIRFPAIDPTTASNISNYSLVRMVKNSDGTTTRWTSRSSSARRPSPRPSPTLDASNTYVLDYNGQISLTLATGLPAGHYVFTAHTKELQYPGLLDAAGNALDDTTVPA